MSEPLNIALSHSKLNTDSITVTEAFTATYSKDLELN